MRQSVKVGFSLFKIRAAEGLQYRLAALSGATVSVFWGLIEIVVITVFFLFGNNASDSINGMTLMQGISYIWIAQALVGLSASGVDGDLMAKIVSGDVGVELCRPLDLYWHWFAKTAAGKASAVVLRGGLVVVCAFLFTLAGWTGIGLAAPHSGLHFALFFIALINAFVFGAAYGMFVTSIRLNVSWGDGPINLILVTGMIFSGGYLPLQLWPDFMQNFLTVQPFAGYIDTPARLYAGSADVSRALYSILFQIFWIVFFIILGRFIMNRKIKNIVVQGG